MKSMLFGWSCTGLREEQYKRNPANGWFERFERCSVNDVSMPPSFSCLSWPHHLENYKSHWSLPKWQLGVILQCNPLYLAVSLYLTFSWWIWTVLCLMGVNTGACAITNRSADQLIDWVRMIFTGEAALNVSTEGLEKLSGLWVYMWHTEPQLFDRCAINWSLWQLFIV